jgi:alanine dehydrogenase
MKIGLIKEIKDNENRVAITPDGVRTLINDGHSVFVTFKAGIGSGYSDDDYIASGATMCDEGRAWGSDLVVKVKEPLIEEYKYFNGQIIFTYLHLAGVDKNLTIKLLSTNTTAIAYESVSDEHGNLPLLSPMSAIAGNMAITIGSYYLQYAGDLRGAGVQLGTINGVNSGNVVVVGDGVVGRHAAKMASGMGSNVVLLGLDVECQKYFGDGCGVTYKKSNKENLENCIRDADLVVGAVSIPGRKAPVVVTEDMVKSMRNGSVIVDVSIDQGGCIATSRMRTHKHPVYSRHGVIHYCVSNMPGTYPRSATDILTQSTLPYIIMLSNIVHNKSFSDIDKLDSNFKKGVYVHAGKITNLNVAESLDLVEYYE